MVNSCSISLHLIQRIVAHVKWSFRCNNIYCWKDSEFECVRHRRVCSIFYWLSFRVLDISSAVCGTLCLDGYYRSRPLVVLLFLLHPHDALIRASLPTYCALHYLFFTLPTFTDNSLTRRTKVGRSKYSQSFLPRIKLYPFQRISRSPHSLIFIASPPSPSGFTLHFVIFAPENSGAYLPDLSAELFSDPFNFFRSNKNRKIITMTDKRVISVIETYQRRLHEKPYVPSTTFGRTTLGANDVANKLFIAFVFSDPDVGVRFLKDVGLIQGSMGCCKYESQMFCCVDSNLTDGYRWWCRGLRLFFNAVLLLQWGTVHGFGKVTAISWRQCSSRTTPFAEFLRTLSNKNMAVMFQRILSSPYSTHLSRHPTQHGWLASSFVVLCAPQAPKRMN